MIFITTCADGEGLQTTPRVKLYWFLDTSVKMIYSTISELPELKSVQSIKTRPLNYFSFQPKTPTAPSLRDLEILNSSHVHPHCDSMASSSNSDTLQWLNVVQTAEEVKRTRNRLAQRKSREREFQSSSLAIKYCSLLGWIGRKEREEANAGDTRYLESRDKSWSSSHSTSPYGATSHPSIQPPDDQSQSFSKGIQRYAWSRVPVVTTIPNFICILNVAFLCYRLLLKA